MGDDAAMLFPVARPADATPAMRPPVGRTSVLVCHPRHAVAASLLGVLFLAGGVVHRDHARRFDAMDDAFITAGPIAIAPRVSGNLMSLPITDNQHVGTGDVIVRVCAT
ncbi:biotin/lipoyl-binding protein [Neoroseomonas lacus]|uniref:Uncharacterized protein n=1 Tax=Neoroseomonas lacus TaxID=287609 RepID=A0A917KBA6_9PROT|nr:biotin/lipoyl-binding protein [Neoroseomonas lacus]GGJ04726.1 hypothetical protein GCM10011320_09550 [Neoroseomonas lacus]